MLVAGASVCISDALTHADGEMCSSAWAGRDGEGMGGGSEEGDAIHVNTLVGTREGGKGGRCEGSTLCNASPTMCTVLAAQRLIFGGDMTPRRHLESPHSLK